MDELEGRIQQVLGDPEQMAQIMSLAQSLMGGEGQAPDAPDAPEPDGGMLSKLGTLFKQQGGQSNQQALLKAMRPYLSEKRQRKMDRAMQLTRMAHLAQLALQGMGGDKDA